MSDAMNSESGSGASESSEAVHTYRCPVCGHTDGVSFMGAQELRIDCTHCGASLELKLRSQEQERVSVQVDTGD